MMSPRKYSKKAQEKIGEVMYEFKEGTLKSSSGDKVTERKKALAIGISEAEQAGLKVTKKEEKVVFRNYFPSSLCVKPIDFLGASITL